MTTFLKRLTLLVTFSFLLLGSCTRGKRDLTEQSGRQLPPVKIEGIPHVAADEIPLVPTEDGYKPAPLPGVETPKPKPYDYVTYIGPSN